MHESTNSLDVRRNDALFKLESSCVDLLQEPVTRQQCAALLLQIVQALEGHSDESYFQIPSSSKKKQLLEVLALDLAWLSPGPFGTWSKTGKQVYYWLEGSRSSSQEGTSWYKRALRRYFGEPDARSLLSLHDIYTRPEFVRLERLSSRGSSNKCSIARNRRSRKWDCAIDAFEPRTDTTLSPTEWSHRFQTYKSCLENELEAEFGPAYPVAAQLAWVYVSPGTFNEPGIPPPWGASLFLVFRFLSGSGNHTHNKESGLLVSNMFHALKTAAQKTLEVQRGKKNIAQTLAHEFKNLNQDVAVLSRAVRNQLDRLPPSTRRELVAIEAPISALELAAQATTAFSKAAYWLFSPKRPGIELRRDAHCRVFRYSMYLAIRLLSLCRPKWRLVGIPPLNRIVDFFRKEFHLCSAQSPADLVADLSVSVMLFFALEPVRNIRANHPDSDDDMIKVRLDVSKSCLRLRQTTFETQRSSGPEHSDAIEFLMNAIQAHCPWKLIDIDPDVQTKCFRTSQPNRFRVERVTSIRVLNIICRIPGKATERRQ